MKGRYLAQNVLSCSARSISTHTVHVTTRRGYSYLMRTAYRSINPGQSATGLVRAGCYNPTSKLSRRYATATSTPQILVNDLRNGHQEILVGFNDQHTVRYPSFWLRDHCRCSECSHPHTKQRQVNTFDIDPSIQAADAVSGPSGLDVTWSQDKHKSHYSWEWLSKHIPFSAAPTTPHARVGWQHANPSAAGKVTVDYPSVMNSDTGLKTLLDQIRTCGFSFISETPSTPEATEALLNRISFIRPTQYGAFWDFTSEAKPVDTAYTNLYLPLHTDTTYFTDPAGLQLFHCLKVATGGGGQSTFSDAFAAATQLYKENPDYYNVLSSVRIVSHASGSSENFGTFLNNAAHGAGFPVFTHSTPHIRPNPKSLTQIRWNNDDRHSATQWPSHERMIVWYRAARRWQELLASPEYRWEVQLQPGTPVIFDNWRIVHGRRAFEGQRRICGGYIGMDEFMARWRAAADVGEQVERPVSENEEEQAEKENEEKVKEEQVQEEKEEKQREEQVEPEVLPQKEEGVDRPVAS
ncbi:hypothetical protein H2198_006124 [Neophaeococcomyces mojaviensis]|uniref:Uncharacterized protein n=1 Tax=Neophaeococcomyces mojaviensis TaxID=3383035 RepID=A0ACC3A406_9EURO|nr:hypothetical protein H2198_006124 [Knufia sp. JES_112]